MDANALRTSSKRQKVFEEQDASQDKDVFSILPDEILVHILSFLSTEEAIRTSILSKRWKCLWMSIGRFNLWIARHVHPSCVLSVLSNVMKHNVQNLKLSLPDGGEFVLPDDLFISKSLSDFCLTMHCTLKLPSFICFSSLKVLNLSGVFFQDDQSIQQLFSGFLVLEHLTLSDCGWENIKEFTIEIPTLRFFRFRQRISFVDNFLNCKIFISAMNLKILQVFGYLIVELLPCNLLSMDEASIWIDRQLEHRHRLLKLLCGLQSVKSLKLIDQALEPILFVGSIQGSLPSFYNLTMLHASVGYHSRAIMHMVQKSPNLKSLILSKGFTANFQDMVTGIIPGCFKYSLKSVVIFIVDGVAEELHFLKYLYENAPVLERFVLVCPTKLLEDLRRQEKIRHELQQLPGGSGSCRIEFHQHRWGLLEMLGL